MAAGTKEDSWVLTTPAGSSEYTMYRDEQADPPALVCQVGPTRLTYRLRAVEDLYAWLVDQPDWTPLGATDETKEPADGTVEAWGRSPDNPVGGWYGLRNGYRGRFGAYLPHLPRPWAWPRSPTPPRQTDAGHGLSARSQTRWGETRSPPAIHPVGAGRGGSGDEEARQAAEPRKGALNEKTPPSEAISQ